MRQRSENARRALPRLWMAALGGETLYEVDLPVCCRRDARNSEDAFECADCGASWSYIETAEPEECAFTTFGDEEERRGAA